MSMLCISNSSVKVNAEDVSLNNENTERYINGDFYEEVEQIGDLEQENNPNSLDRVAESNDFEIDTTDDETGTNTNTDPNTAYMVNNGDVVQGELSQTNEMRWYAFSLQQKNKISIILQMASSVDADIYLFSLNQETSKLGLIGGSATEGKGVNEFCTQVLDTGIYYFAVSAYEGNGKYGFAFYSTSDITYEINDTKENATQIGVNIDINGFIDTPFDIDYYKFTISKPMIATLSADVLDYSFGMVNDDTSKIYKISKKDDVYQFDAGTYYLVVYSKDNKYDSAKSYSIHLNKISDIAADSNSCCYMVNKRAGIVFQTDANGGNMYVNGNNIDIAYSYIVDASNSGGMQKYDISLTNPADMRAKIYQNEFVFDDAETTTRYGMLMPDAVYYFNGTKGVGPSGNVLELSLYSSKEKFYKIHCSCSGSYANNTYNKDLNFVTVFIDPNTGKLVDIEHINYFYEYLGGSNSMTFTRPYSSDTKYYYQYYNSEEPTEW